jgi:hypothetical protein
MIIAFFHNFKSMDMNYTSPEDGWASVYSDEANHWTVSGLDGRSVYQFRVRARNKFGWSNYSDASLPFKMEQLLAQKDNTGQSLTDMYAQIYLYIYILL